MTQMVILPFIAAMVTAVASLAVKEKQVRDYVSTTGNLAYSGLAVYLSLEVLGSGPLSYALGGWEAPFGITLLADELSAFMLLMTAVVSLAGNVYSSSFVSDDAKSSGYYVFLNFMLAGMTGAFLTADLFNLFVMFELVLLSSYAIVSIRDNRRQLFTSLKYVVMNLLGSSFMLVAIGGIYGVTGSLNMAAISRRLAQNPSMAGPVLGFSVLLFTVFALKSGLVPFHFWAPHVYSDSPAPASAMMAGISKKVGIYAIIRVFVTVLGSTALGAKTLMPGLEVGAAIGTLLFVMSCATVLLGGVSAINRKTLDRILSYSSIGQVGFITLPIALFLTGAAESALAASLVYTLSHSISKSGLFMASGTIKKAAGTDSIEDLGGVSEADRTLAASFFVLAFSLVGIPPLLGFLGKLSVFRSAVSAGSPGALLVLLIGAVMTLLYFTKSWLSAFFGEVKSFDASEVSGGEKAAIASLAAVAIAAGLAGGEVYSLAQQGADAAADTQGYIDAVLGGETG